MQILKNAPQGSQAWHAARATHFCASEAAAAMGVSKYTTRDALLHQKATGIAEEVSPAKQRIFDAGHEAEANAREFAERLAGLQFYPVVGVANIDGLQLLASFDGIDMLEEVIWENKLLNASLLEQVKNNDLEPHYWSQLEHQLLVAESVERALFTTSDGTEAGTHECWYKSQPERRAKVIAAWKQFAADLAAYTPPVAVVEAIGHTPETLPALRIEVTGMVTASNLADYKAHALAVFGGINRELSTDQQFADAEKVVKWCADVEDRLAAAKQHALSQTASIDELFRAIDDISAEARRTRLELDKLVKARKEAVRGEIVVEGVAALCAHIDGLNQRLGKPYMPVITADFGGAVKGKRTVDSLRDAVNTTLANAKIDASATADKIQTNLTTLRELATSHAFLFSDTAQIVQKAPDDLTMLVKTRIAEHQAAEAEKLEAQRAKIRAEEETKARAEAEVKLRAEQAAERAALQAKEQQAQAEIAAAQKAGALPAPLAADLSGLVQEQRAQAVAGLDAQQVIGAAQRLPVVAPASPANTAPADDDDERINLGAINEHLQKLSVNAAQLAALGFEPVATVKASKLYRACDVARIRAALMQHLAQLEELQAA